MNCDNCDKVEICEISKKVVYDNALLIQKVTKKSESYMSMIKGIKTLLASYCCHFKEKENEQE